MSLSKKSKIAIYPASFNPVHQGHLEILEKAMSAGFDGIIMLVCCPDEKAGVERAKLIVEALDGDPRIGVEVWSGLLPHFVKMKQEIFASNNTEAEITALIRGLRNGNDLQHEQNLMYWYQDMGLTVPIVYFISDREYTHYSSSAIRELTIYGAYNQTPQDEYEE